MRLLPAFCAALALLTASPLAADEKHHDHGGTVQAMDAWARETTPSAKAGGIFMTLHNLSEMDDRLIAAATDVAGHVELHTHIKDGDVMRMRQVETIDIPAGGDVALAPGGLHVMLFDLKQQLVEGESFPVTLTFEHGGEQTLAVEIKDIRHKGGMQHSHGSH